MQELEKILEELNRRINEYVDHDYVRGSGDVVKGLSIAKSIIRKHMNDGWISVEKFGLPHNNEHDLKFWVTIQYTNGFTHTIKARWDCFDKCFMHQNGNKILQDIIAYKYYSAPEPYRTERSEGE